MIFVGENCRQKSQNNFSGKSGEIRAKILRIPKILLAPTPMQITTYQTFSVHENHTT